MHVDWNWIYQRPHVFATKLSRDFGVHVLYRINIFRKQLVRNPKISSCYPLLPVPEKWFGPFARFIQKTWVTLWWMIWRPDVVWVTFPDLYRIVPKRLLKGKRLVYDCMDAAGTFFPDSNERAAMDRLEKELVDRADLVLCSSSLLQDRIRGIRPDANTMLVRNGSDSAKVTPSAPPVTSGSDVLDICYFGTVSSWMDWPLIKDVLERDERVTFHFIGPVEQGAPVHDRIVCHGPVAHGELFSMLDRFHGFILPFAATELVRHVDPVKLYEYVASGRPVLCRHYPEVERFRPYVNFYSDAEQCLALLERLRNGDPSLVPDREEANAFLAANTWDARYEEVRDALLSLSALHQK